MAEWIKGTQGYKTADEQMLQRYEAFSVEQVYEPLWDLFPRDPAHVIDIGAGTGRDAAWFAQRGATVTAVEPTDTLRLAAQELHPLTNIEWIDDGLPDLTALNGREGRFDLMLLCAVWMHIDADERARAMPIVARLLSPRGRMILVLRHGPVPEGRRMFAVSPQEVVEQAERAGLTMLRQVARESLQLPNRAAGVHWTLFAFEKG